MTEFTQAKEGGYIDIRTRKGISMKKKAGNKTRNWNKQKIKL